LGGWEGHTLSDPGPTFRPSGLPAFDLPTRRSSLVD
jgi:hypothetical protein